eukprot:6633463-Lingulodinium_polyedra.AAC.1
MAVPPCAPPLGPRLTQVCTTAVRGKTPDAHIGAVAFVQCVSCNMTTVPASTIACSTAFLSATFS